MVVVRPADASDVDRIAEIHVRSWQAAYREILPEDFLAALSIDRRRESWASMVGDEQTFVVEVDGTVDGFVRVAPAEDSTLGEVQSIYLEPSSHRRGLGTALLTAGEHRLRELGFDDAILWVFVANTPARRFYEARSWMAEARTALMELGGRQLTEIRYRKSLL